MASSLRPFFPLGGYIEGRSDETDTICVHIPSAAFPFTKGRKCLLRIQVFDHPEIEEHHKNFEVERLRHCCKLYEKGEFDWPDLFFKFVSTCRAVKGILTSIHYEGTPNNRTWTHVQPLRDDRFYLKGGKVRRWEYGVDSEGRYYLY